MSHEQVTHNESHRRRVAQPRHVFHPFELAVCGRKGSGRTRLIEALTLRLSTTLRVGYAKRDIHGFQMDHPGKDTQRATEAGARAVWIESAVECAGRNLVSASEAQRLLAFTGCDLVLVEGWADDQLMPKILLMDGWQPGPRLHGLAAIVTMDAALLQSGRCPEWLGHEQIPLFHRDNLDGISAWVESLFQARIALRPLKGLVLTGGLGRRLGQDKALLEVAGLLMAERSARLLDPLCREVRLSVRSIDQAGRAALGRPLLADRYLDMGPAGGILSALDQDPMAAWLVLGCDLPLVDAALLQVLLKGRNPWRPGTAFRSAQTGDPEPLCAVWEPRSRALLLQQLSCGAPCPGRALRMGADLLDLPDDAALLNVNHPQDLAEAEARMSGLPFEPGGGKRA